MLDKLRRRAQATTTSLPLYRVIPGRATRTYAAVHYHAANSSADEVVAYLEEHDSPIPTTRYSGLLIAAESSFVTGHDDAVVRYLDELSSRYPDQAEPEVLRARLLVFQGDHDTALLHARRAVTLDPTSATAAAQVVKLSYETHAEDADDVAIAALARLPAAAGVVWQACKHCRSEEQYRRIVGIYPDTLPRPTPARVEPRLQNLATAAARAGLLDSAIDLYAQAMLLRLGGVNPHREVKEKQLAGRGAWHAIDDVMEVLESVGMPFFLAAGTALGMVRAKGPLGHDSDIDVGVLAQDWDHATLVEAFNTHPRFELDVAHPEHDKVYLKHRRGSSLDIWRFYEDGGKVWHDGLLTRWGNTPFAIERRTVRKRSIPLPADAERYLTESYGDWRTPDPDFDAFCDAPNVEVTWPAYLRFHRVRRAYRYLTAGHVQAAAEQLGLARPDLDATPNGRRLAEELDL